MSGFLRAIAKFSCLLLLAGGFSLSAAASPAAATSTLLCKGYDGCSKLNMSHAGYKASGGSMYWRMYSGHNCTNYAAYRMIKSGMPNVRPWMGGGNASNWGHYMSKMTNSTPAVGAVAWWDVNVRPAGSSGHVAYVERVISATEIVVSQDSWGGDFSWARITKAGGSWPSGFVHFNDVALQNSQRPKASGTPKVGAVLSASPGAWSPSGLSYAYQWRANGVNIASATASTLALKLPQQGKRISVRITASKVGYPSTTARSPNTIPVEPGVIANTSSPVITGAARVDAPLSATVGQWTPTPTSLTFQWAADGTPIRGATAAAFTPGPTMVGKSLAVTVTAKRTGYDDVAVTSTRTTPVDRATFTASGATAITGTLRPTETLQLSPTTFTPADGATSTQWLRDGVPIAGAHTSSYQLTVDDLGARIAGRLTVTKPGYTTIATTAKSSRLVKAAPRMRKLAESTKGRLRLTVNVSANGVTDVPGTVLVKSRGKVLAELTLRQGTAATTLRGFPAGRRLVNLRYLGSEKVETTKLSRTLRFR